MPSLSRREFVLATAGLLLAPRTSIAADARVDILLDERIGPISADFYVPAFRK